MAEPDADDFLITGESWLGAERPVLGYLGPISTSVLNPPLGNEINHMYEQLRLAAIKANVIANAVVGLEIEADPFTGMWTARGTLAVRQ